MNFHEEMFEMVEEALIDDLQRELNDIRSWGGIVLNDEIEREVTVKDHKKTVTFSVMVAWGKNAIGDPLILPHSRSYTVRICGKA